MGGVTSTSTLELLGRFLSVGGEMINDLQLATFS